MHFALIVICERIFTVEDLKESERCPCDNFLVVAEVNIKSFAREAPFLSWPSCANASRGLWVTVEKEKAPSPVKHKRMIKVEFLRYITSQSLSLIQNRTD